MNLAISLTPYPGQVPGGVWIQLLDTSAGPRLLSSDLSEPLPSHSPSRTKVYSLPLSGGGPLTEVVDHYQLMPSQERWDATTRPDGRIVAAFTVFTGGDYGVQVSGKPGARPPDARPPSAPPFPWSVPPDLVRKSSFQGARFVRGLEGRLVVSALQWGAQPVLFADLQLGESPDEGLSLRELAFKCVDAIFVADREGLGLVYRRPPTVRPGTQYDLIQGEVGYVRLDAALKPILPATVLFPGGVVDEIDATPLADGLAVVVATGTGLGVVTVGRRPGGFEVLGRKDVALPGKLRSPSIVAAGGKLLVAALHDGAVLVGEVALGP